MDTSNPDRQTNHVGGVHVAMGDGGVAFITDSMEQALRLALVTNAGGEQLGF